MGWFKKDKPDHGGASKSSAARSSSKNSSSAKNNNNVSSSAQQQQQVSSSSALERGERVAASTGPAPVERPPPPTTSSSSNNNRALGVVGPNHSIAAHSYGAASENSANLAPVNRESNNNTTREPSAQYEHRESKRVYEDGGVDNDNDHHNLHNNMSEVEAGKSYSAEYDQYENSGGGGGAGGVGDGSDPVTDAVRQNHLNSLFNGHLMKWKFEAEEGSPFIRIPAFIGALALIVTSVMSLVMEPDSWTTHSIVMAVCILIMSIFVLILDGRFLATNPLSARAHLRNIMTRNFNIFRFLWGRGLLYICAGILSVAQMWIVNVYSGAFMIAVGVIALIVGVHASRKFAALRNSLADESFLLLVFSNYDTDGDGYVNPSEFAVLLSDLGMELDDRYTLKAFNVIDTDNDRRISFEEFSHWWASGYIERGRKRRDDELGGEHQGHHGGHDDEVYRRMN